MDSLLHGREAFQERLGASRSGGCVGAILGLALKGVVLGSNSSWCWARHGTATLTSPAWKGATSYIKSSAQKIHTVHMVYMNHYDVGYTVNMAASERLFALGCVFTPMALCCRLL